MFRPIMSAILNEFSAERCLADLTRHWLCRSTVPGPAMHRASAQLVERYREHGALAAHLTYPADDRTEFLDGRRLSLEWTPRSASLRIVAPAGEAGLVCRYLDEPLCLVSNSVATPPGGVEAEVIVRRGPLRAEAVTAGEWAGRLLFTDQPPAAVAQAAHRAGAVGIISDCVCPPWLAQHPPLREAADVPDLVMWSIFPGRRSQPPLFGFMLSPRQGRRLRALAERGLRLRAEVDARLSEGLQDLVEATLPGSDLADEEIWALAHSSEPGARDNASGCALCVELARVLQTLTARGDLPPLRRTIRFLHAVEVEGFIPYLDARRAAWPAVLAGACVDSVAQDYRRCGGEMVLFRAPVENASFVDGLMQTLLGAAADLPVQHSGADSYVRYPWHTEPFFGNDAFIADGFFDIPTPQPSTWPDRYYHSNLDTPDQVGADCLIRSAGVFGTFLYLLATAGAAEARWLGGLAALDYRQRMVDQVNEGLADGQLDGAAAGNLAERVRQLGLQGGDAITQTARFAPEDGHLANHLTHLAGDLLVHAESDLGALIEELSGAALAPPEAPTTGDRRVPRRRRWHLPPAAALPSEVSGSSPPTAAAIWPWINGRRSVLEIGERLALREPAAWATLSNQITALAAAGLLELAEGG